MAKASSSSSPSKTQSPTKGNQPPMKGSTPPRKQETKRESTPHLDRLRSANQVKYKLVGIDRVAVGLIYKPDGIQPAFLGNILSHIEGNPSRMNHCKLMLMTQLRNPDGTNAVLETENKAGNKYPSDIVVFATDDTTSIARAAFNLGSTLSSIAKNECRNDWKFGIPLFCSKGDATPPAEPSLAHYLLNEDCITVTKRVFEGCDTKEEFMNNEFRDMILETVFGNASNGLAVVEGMPEELFDEL